LDAFEIIHKNGFRSVANILVGIPYEDIKSQLEDAVDSVKFCANNNIDEVVLFPYNAKPNTKTWHDGVFQVSAWLPIEVLKRYQGCILHGMVIRKYA
jgi:uncharacterized Fe-S cluster-containing MiaB family protein